MYAGRQAGRKAARHAGRQAGRQAGRKEAARRVSWQTRIQAQTASMHTTTVRHQPHRDAEHISCIQV